MGLNNDNRATYCCGYQSENNNATRCSNGDAPFVLDDGDMIFGRAALVNVTASGFDPSTTKTTNTTGGNEGNGETPSRNSTAVIGVGVGVGVPLGVLVLCGVAWALTERRRSRRRQPTMTGAEQATEQAYRPPQRKSGPTELYQPTKTNSDTLIHGSPLVEIMGSEARRD
ncbi:hypothetical protein N7508_006289 [Penicillium antarcticum]|nr:uncharacterized protein N7508_006289 [Penicillium antarcticum]KAJ5301426.1 hypothetical protein N7508_006289 [Penicillium antarcticum]